MVKTPQSFITIVSLPFRHLLDIVYIYIYILPRYMSFVNPSTLSVDGCLIIFRVLKN